MRAASGRLDPLGQLLERQPAPRRRPRAAARRPPRGRRRETRSSGCCSCTVRKLTTGGGSQSTASLTVRAVAVTPTNDLDFASLEVLEAALRDYPGAIVAVSRPRLPRGDPDQPASCASVRGRLSRRRRVCAELRARIASGALIGIGLVLAWLGLLLPWEQWRAEAKSPTAIGADWLGRRVRRVADVLDRACGSDGARGRGIVAPSALALRRPGRCRARTRDPGHARDRRGGGRHVGLRVRRARRWRHPRAGRRRRPARRRDRRAPAAGAAARRRARRVRARDRRCRGVAAERRPSRRRGDRRLRHRAGQHDGLQGDTLYRVAGGELFAVPAPDREYRRSGCGPRPTTSGSSRSRATSPTRPSAASIA